MSWVRITLGGISCPTCGRPHASEVHALRIRSTLEVEPAEPTSENDVTWKPRPRRHRRRPPDQVTECGIEVDRWKDDFRGRRVLDAGVIYRRTQKRVDCSRCLDSLQRRHLDPLMGVIRGDV